MSLSRRHLLTGFSALALATGVEAAPAKPQKPFTNGLGMDMVPLPAGKFTMGLSDPSLSRDWYNERPAHPVILSQGFYMADNPVTLAQFRQFRPDFEGSPDGGDYATGLNWHDAVAFCAWLSKKEGRIYRLPTEAEWEYVARRQDPKLSSLQTKPLQWLHDGYGPYASGAVTDPVGAHNDQLKCVRGGRMAYNAKRQPPRGEIDYSRVEARLAFPPAFGAFPGLKGGGFHAIGFRVVAGPLPKSTEVRPDLPYHQIGARTAGDWSRLGPPADAPYFRKRVYLPTPFDDASNASDQAAGFEDSFRPHDHSPGLTVLPNGDVLVAIYSSYDEYEAGSSIIATRLRHGADEWDMPAPFADIIGVNDHAPLLMRDGNTVRFFWGSPFLGEEDSGPHGFPFQMMSSTDNGATWSAVGYPRMRDAPGGHLRQPITSAFRDQKGRLLLASDGKASPNDKMGDYQSLLWASEDNGVTWYDTGGRTYGRHTAFIEARDGRLLGYGGKNTEINGYMPVSVSTDGGKTYTWAAGPFPGLGSVQRPSIIKLASGRWLVLSDWRGNVAGLKPVTTKTGSFVAISDDEGKTWKYKDLPGTGLSEREKYAQLTGGGTVGYGVIAQAPNGVIHAITTGSRPSLHFAFNEAWIDAPEGMVAPEQAVAIVGTPQSFTEKTGTWSGGKTAGGDFVLHGPQIWRDAQGRAHWEITYKNGRRDGVEKRYDAYGRLSETWTHNADGSKVWTRFWPNGKMKSQSHWQGMKAVGEARLWDETGTLISTANFVDGGIPGTVSERDKYLQGS